MRKKLLSLLVLLMVAVTGAWATEVTIATNQQQTSYTSGNITISVPSGLGDGDGDLVSSWCPMIITCGDGNVLQSVVVTIGYYPDNASDVTASAGSCEVSGDGNKHSTYVTVTGINASSVSIGCNGDVQIEQVVVNYGPSAPEPEPQPAGYAVSLKAETADEGNWTAKAGEGEYQSLPLEGVAEGTQVTVTYSGLKKVKSVKAVKKAAEEPVTLATPLTLEATSDGTIVVNNPMEGMKYSLNGAAKTTDGIAEITVSAGDKVAFYGDGTNITAYFVNVRTYTSIAGGTATVKVYGNIMSLVDEEGFATATELTGNCAFYYLFDSNTTLTDASGLLLPATTLTIDCYYSMFRNCTSLTTSPAELPATTLARRCYASMFLGCTSLATAPELPATTLNERCYYGMFRNCESLTTAPELKAETLTPECYYSMFMGCTSLTTAPELKATTLNERCYYSMFQGCTSLTAVPELKATTLAIDCYNRMFSNCTSLTAVPADLLPATELAQECYYSMFDGCTGLTTVPADFLPATTMAEGCYYYMFNGCTGLTTVPADLLKAEELAKQCYCKMFYGCTVLTAAPNLPATTLPESCYQGMFQGCTGLTAAPAFGTMTTVGKNSCKNMFQGCTGLTAAPALGATTLDEGCYYSMFQGCEALTTVPAKLPAQTLAKDCYNSMFMGCTSLTTAPAIDATTLANTCCSSMFQDCASLTAAPELPATPLATSCYQKMFMGCISLTAAPALPATELANTCYLSMFQGCTSLTTAPELPAQTLKVQCYRNMFQGCTSLPAAPELPAQTLVSNCYNGMFQDCPSLASVTCLATNISASGCLTNWLINAGTMATEPKLYVDASMTEAAWNNGIFTVTVNAPAGPTTVTWNSSNVSDIRFWGGAPDGWDSYTKEGITLRGNAEQCDAEWADFGNGPGIMFAMNAPGGYTFTAPDGKKFTKIEITATTNEGWYTYAYFSQLESGWPAGEAAANDFNSTLKFTWTGSAASVNLATTLNSFGPSLASSIEFTLE